MAGGILTPGYLILCIAASSVLLVDSESGDNIRSTTASSSSDGAPANNGYAKLLNIQLDEKLEPKTIRHGQKLTLECLITGFPTPQYRWFKDGRRITDSDRRYFITDVLWGNRLKIPSTVAADAGVYKCEAINIAGSKNTSAVITISPEIKATTEARVRKPQPFTNSDGAVTKQPFCQEYKGTYCGFLKSKEIYVTSRIAQHKGELSVVDLVSQLTQLNVQGDSKCFQKSVEAACYDRMPVCAERESLPPIPRRLCKKECMALYLLCKNDFPEDVNWNVLPQCGRLNNHAGCVHIGLTALTKGSGPEKPSGSKDSNISDMLIQIGLPVLLAVLLLVAITVVAVCFCRRRNKLRGGNSLPSSNGSQGKSVELSSLSDRAAPVYIKDVSLENINMLQELGESCYGKVYHGQVFGLYGNNTASVVFIKCLQEKANPEQMAEFRDEVAAMSEIRHQHIVSLLAISTKGLTQCLLYEYLQLGDLRQFQLSQQSRGNCLTNKELMYIVTQVASALEYLSSLQYIHRDVASHNVIVSHNLNVKLSSLNIINGVHSANYCTIHNRMLPIRWLPAESITYNKFSLETDIYSYGVLLWEAFSNAQQPYAGFTNQEVIEMVRSRQLLACPSLCPPRIYSLMMECWHEVPNKRPTAKEVHQKLRAWYLDNSYAISTTTGPSISASGSTCTAPSHHSSSGVPASNPNSNHTNITDIQGSRLAVDCETAMRPGYLQHNKVGQDDPPYYSTIDSSYDPGRHTPSSSSFDNASEYTDSTVPPLQPSANHKLPPNYYTSTPTNRYASLTRRHNDTEFGTQTTPLFQQTDQV